MAGRRPARSIDPATFTTWQGIAYCHVPADEPVRLDRLVSSDGSDDRWNGPGQPTLYLALDPATALGELARHLELAPGTTTWRRRLVGVHVAVDRLADLRRADVHAALGIGEPAAFRDRDLARNVAADLRNEDGCAGLLVPSMTFLDDPARGNLVVFVDRFDGGIPDIVGGMADAGIVELRLPGAAPRGLAAADMKRGRSPGGGNPQGHETDPAAEEGRGRRVAKR
jgi:RES domain-containing protein